MGKTESEEGGGNKKPRGLLTVVALQRGVIGGVVLSLVSFFAGCCVLFSRGADQLLNVEEGDGRH